MMSKFYVIRGEYEPNSAPHNRLVSFLNVYESYGIETELVFLFPNSCESKPDLTYKHIKVSYLYEDCRLFHNRIVAKLCAPWLFRRLIKDKLHKGDIVLALNADGIMLKMLKKSGKVALYHETTEHPDIGNWRIERLKKIYLDSCRTIDGMFVISTSLKKYFASIRVPEEKITIVNMTVDPNRFNGVIKNTSVEKYIAYCGTASNNKDGVDILIKAFGIVARKHKDVKLYIIGKAPSATDESGNLQLVEALGIKDRVVFTGVISAKEMPQMLTNAAVLALARPNNLQAQNGFPTKLGEYLLTGNPVVVTKVGDIPLFLKDGESALLSEPDDVEAFADKLCWALEHPVECGEIGKNGRNVAMANFNASIEAKKIIQTIFHGI